jgi:hypothetical protein
VIEKKKIDSEKAREVMARSDEIPKSVLTARQFVVMYFDRLRALQQSGRSLKATHQFLAANGIDVGTYESFRTVYRQVKRTQTQTAAAKSVEIAKSGEAIPVNEDKAKNTDAGKTYREPMESRLRPLRLSNGREILIDPETGAKHFKI